MRNLKKVNCATLREIQAVNIAQQLEEVGKKTPQRGRQSKQKTPLLENLQAACKYPLITPLWEMIQRSFLFFWNWKSVAVNV